MNDNDIMNDNADDETVKRKMSHYDIPRGSLHERTLELLREDGRPVDQIALIAQPLPRSWISKFRSGGLSDPSVNRVQYLYEILTEDKLDV